MKSSRKTKSTEAKWIHARPPGMPVNLVSVASYGGRYFAQFMITEGQKIMVEISESAYSGLRNLIKVDVLET